MSTLAELLDPKTPVLAALKNILETATDYTFYTELSGEGKEGALWGEIEYEPGTQSNHMYPCPSGFIVRDHWPQGSLMVRLLSSREVESDRPAQIAAHQTARRLVVAALAPGQSQFGTDASPLHEIPRIKFLGSAAGVSQQNDQDITELRFEVFAGIRASELDAAFPA